MSRGRHRSGCPSASLQARPHGPAEVEIHPEHEAALEATLFQRTGQPDELVLELADGQLRIVSKEA
ncbi:MAG: hypothetical protein VCC04_15730 [Myxococcota bacterium]